MKISGFYNGKNRLDYYAFLVVFADLADVFFKEAVLQEEVLLEDFFEEKFKELLLEEAVSC